jgi:formate-dependent nitrite reductase membrane component NrfD
MQLMLLLMFVLSSKQNVDQVAIAACTTVLVATALMRLFAFVWCHLLP